MLWINRGDCSGKRAKRDPRADTLLTHVNQLLFVRFCLRLLCVILPFILPAWVFLLLVSLCWDVSGIPSIPNIPNIPGRGRDTVSPVVHLLTTLYQMGGRLTKKAMAQVETHVQRLTGFERWFLDIPYTPSPSPDT